MTDRGDAARYRLPANVVLLGVVSLLTDAASETAVALLPAFLGTIGAGALALGTIEGAAEAVAAVLKLVSGRWADRLGRNRPFVVGGYALSSVVKPLLALATVAWHVLAVRVVDRVGKGLRSSPRDAILAASVDPQHRGRAFGWHRAMDHAGAVIGPLCAAGYLLVSDDLRRLFWLTAIPSGAVILTVLRVRDVPARRGTSPRPTESEGESSGGLGRLLAPLCLFTLGNASDTFLLLRAGGSNSPLVELPLLWMGLHVVKATTSVYGGRLADRLGLRRVIAAGWSFYALIYAAFAFAESRAAIVALFVVYGVYHGLTEGTEKALVAEIVPARKRGAGFGWYYLTQGTLALVANVLFGALWTGLGARVAFLSSAAIACAAVALLTWLAPGGSRPRIPA
jgi:MFS family permease